MELLIFATGNIYRETGTASKHIEDKSFAMKKSQQIYILVEKVAQMKHFG